MKNKEKFEIGIPVKIETIGDLKQLMLSVDKEFDSIKLVAFSGSLQGVKVGGEDDSKIFESVKMCIITHRDNSIEQKCVIEVN